MKKKTKKLKIKENPYYYDLSTPMLKEYYNSLTNKNASEKHIMQVEKELESRY